jgi:hypothetical protein
MDSNTTANLKDKLMALLWPEPHSLKDVFIALLGPELSACILDVQEILAFNLSELERRPFLTFHDFITNPRPHFITDWQQSPQLEKWYHSLVDGVENTCRAYAAVWYHFEKLSAFESQVLQKLSERDYCRALGNGTFGLGNTLKWDFEYQAFVLAYRRCLDYLTRGLAAFFKQEFHSFRTLLLPKNLPQWRPKSVAEALISVHKRHCSNFDFVLSEGNRKSVRDKIAHYEWVDAGTINLTQNGFVLMGGGEALSFTQDFNSKRLAAALESRVRMLKAYINEMLMVFVASARVWDDAEYHSG